MPAASTKPIRVFLGKVGLDGHDRGLLTVARALQETGMEVVYGGVRKTAEQVARAAIQEDVEAVGLSSLSGAHSTHFAKVARLLSKLGRREILLFCGGIIPPGDHAALCRAGFARVFTPGATLADITQFIQETLRPARPVKLAGLDHIAIATHDLEKSLALFCGALGMRETGRETVPSQKVRTTFLEFKGTHLELLEADREGSPVENFLKTRGGGVHHVAFAVKNVPEAISQARAAGLTMIDVAPRPGARGKEVAFAHPTATHGTLMEFTAPKRQKQKQLTTNKRK